MLSLITWPRKYNRFVLNLHPRFIFENAKERSEFDQLHRICDRLSIHKQTQIYAVLCEVCMHWWHCLTKKKKQLQGAMCISFDQRSRKRKIIIQICGETLTPNAEYVFIYYRHISKRLLYVIVSVKPPNLSNIKIKHCML